MSHFSYRTFISLFALGFILLPFNTKAKTQTIAERLSGRILLQVQSHGEAWYVDPISKQRFYLGTATDAFNLLRSKGLGIRHSDVMRYTNTAQFPVRLAGRILIDVDDRGQAYYILPTTLRAARLGNAEETYQVLRQTGLGISNTDLNRIVPAAQTVATAPVQVPNPTPNTTTPVTPTPAPIITAPSILTPTPSTNQLSTTPSSESRLEELTHSAINQHRASIGLPSLSWNTIVANVARIHSQNMADGRVPFSHDGFDARFEQISEQLPLSNMAENVAFNNFDDPVATAVRGWLESPGHRTNIENNVYTQTGIGIVKNSTGEYYFTQIFIKPSGR